MSVNETNAAVLLDIADFVSPCEGCDKKVCGRNYCKLVTIDEISLYKGLLGPRYRPNCRTMNYYPSFAMLANTIHDETNDLI